MNIIVLLTDNEILFLLLGYISLLHIFSWFWILDTTMLIHDLQFLVRHPFMWLLLFFESNFQDKNMAYSRKLYKRAVMDVTPTDEKTTLPHEHFSDHNRKVAAARAISGKNLDFCCSMQLFSMRPKNTFRHKLYNRGFINWNTSVNHINNDQCGKGIKEKCRKSSWNNTYTRMGCYRDYHSHITCCMRFNILLCKTILPKETRQGWQKRNERRWFKIGTVTWFSV